jgi:hypothetical protein
MKVLLIRVLWDIIPHMLQRIHFQSAFETGKQAMCTALTTVND